ncbi:MAG: TraM recognition domain-containing protein [Propionibacterium sp.]|nr:TraM recognition domain-containing protein [Propionibacterium sp.]
MATRHQASTNPTAATYVAAGALVVVGFVLVWPWLILRLTHTLTTDDDPRWPWQWWAMLIGGETPPWGVRVSLWTLLAVAAAVAVVWGCTRLVRSSAVLRPYRQAAAALASARAQFKPLLDRGARKTGDRLGVHAPNPGVFLGRLRPFGKSVWATWEMTVLVVAGPRKMKTTAYAIPQVCSAPGAVIATSNKVDLVRVTRHLRETKTPSCRVWVFDPMHIESRNPPTFTWNPLSYIRPGEDLALTRAHHLAEEFMNAAGAMPPADSNADQSWSSTGEELLAGLLLAGAVKGVSMQHVLSWLSDPDDTQPVDLLRADVRFSVVAQRVASIMATTPKQRDGYLAPARKGLAWLAESAIAAWVTPTEGLPTFDPLAFARSHDTLYILCEKDSQGAGPLVTALTRACIEGAKEQASREPSGRLTTPMLIVLDEAANICRLRTLPDMYSHMGSRGIILSTIIQSWAQGMSAWGESGMQAMWSAASTRIYGGGEASPRFLSDTSTLLGKRQEETVSHSTSRGVTNTQRSMRDVDVLTPGQLMELPSGWALALTSHTPAFLIEPVPFWEGPFKKELGEHAQAGQALAQVEETRNE